VEIEKRAGGLKKPELGYDPKILGGRGLETVGGGKILSKFRFG